MLHWPLDVPGPHFEGEYFNFNLVSSVGELGKVWVLTQALLCFFCSCVVSLAVQPEAEAAMVNTFSWKFSPLSSPLGLPLPPWRWSCALWHIVGHFLHLEARLELIREPGGPPTGRACQGFCCVRVIVMETMRSRSEHLTGRAFGFLKGERRAHTKKSSWTVLWKITGSLHLILLGTIPGCRKGFPSGASWK